MNKVFRIHLQYRKLNFCYDLGICDEALLAAIIKAAASEKERSMLQAPAQTPKKVIRVHETTHRQEEGKPKQHDDSISKLVPAVDVLTSKLTSLQ